MRVFAKILTVITLLALLAAGYVIWASAAQVSAQGYKVEAAADRAGSFAGVVEALRSGSDSIVSYDGAPVGGADQYVFVTYTIRVRNADLVPFEWIDLSVRSKEGDVLLVKPAVQDIPALNQSLLSFTLMAQRGLIDYERQATLSYYVYGHYRQVPVTLK